MCSILPPNLKKENIVDNSNVYILFEVMRDGEEQLVDLYWDRAEPDRIAAEHPTGIYGGYYVAEWKIK